MDNAGAERAASGAAAAEGRPLRILYAAGLSPNDSSLYRLWAMERLGHRVVPLNAYDYRPRIRCWTRLRTGWRQGLW